VISRVGEASFCIFEVEAAPLLPNGRLDEGLGGTLFAVRGATPRAESVRAAAAPDVRVLLKPDVSSSTSVSSSLRLLFQTLTMASAPDEVKKSPPGEKLHVVEEPSCPYNEYRMWPYLKSQIFTVESEDADSR